MISNQSIFNFLSSSRGHAKPFLVLNKNCKSRIYSTINIQKTNNEAEVESRTQRLRPRTQKKKSKADFSRTHPFEAKDRNGLDRGQFF